MPYGDDSEIAVVHDLVVLVVMIVVEEAVPWDDA
jgi:hypothetical protein